jgi:hypothetical protein
VKSAVNVFVNAVGRIRDDIDTISPEGDARDFVGREKRRRLELNRIPDIKEVCDRIATEAVSRFQSSSHPDAAKLLDCSNFLEYSKNSREHIRFGC